MRYILLFLLGLFAIWYLRRSMEGRRRDNSRTREPSNQSETMRECAHCGLLIPGSEAVRDGNLFYCCPEHRRAGPRV